MVATVIFKSTLYEQSLIKDNCSYALISMFERYSVITSERSSLSDIMLSPYCSTISRSIPAESCCIPRIIVPQNGHLSGYSIFAFVSHSALHLMHFIISPFLPLLGQSTLTILNILLLIIMIQRMKLIYVPPSQNVP